MGENVYSLGEGSTGLLHGHLHEPLLWLINGPEGLDMKAAKYHRVNQRLYKRKTFLYGSLDERTGTYNESP